MDLFHQGTVLGPDTWEPGPLQVFLFSAATWNPHRIHYDTAYARSEGYADTIVQGPLQGALLESFLTSQAGARASLDEFTYRHAAPAPVGERYVLEGWVVDVLAPGPIAVCEVSLTMRDGTVTTRGTGHLRAVAPGY